MSYDGSYRILLSVAGTGGILKGVEASDGIIDQ